MNDSAHARSQDRPMAGWIGALIATLVGALILGLVATGEYLYQMHWSVN